MTNDVFTLDENNNAAIRTVGVNPGSAETNSPSVFTEDENGNTCIRVTGSGGGSVDESKVIVLSDTIPTADADNLGKFYCYKGTTNASYTHGYVYECVEGSTYYVANIAFEQSTFASESFEKAGQLIVDAGVSDPTEVTGGTMTYALAGNLWSIVFTDENGNDLNTPYSIYTDDLEQDYDILPVIDPSDFVDGQVVSMTINNVSEEQGYVWERIDLQPAAKLGRYLAGWNCATGLAMTNPPESPYEYTTGDYFIVGVVATGGASNYKPNGSSYTTGVASSTVESESVSVNDMYLYDGTNWTLLKTGSTVTSVNGQTGDVTIGINDILPDQTGHSGHVLGTDGFVAGWVAPEKVQRSVMPQASEDEEGNIYQFVGTTDANYTNGYFYKCVSDGQVPATYSWTRVDVQPAGSSLPSQTGNAGKFLVTDGTDASWDTSVKQLRIKTSSTLYCDFYVAGPTGGGTGIYFNSGSGQNVQLGGNFVGGLSYISKLYVREIYYGGFNSQGITVPAVGGTLALQIATMPTAGSTYEGTIYQFTGTTDSTYTNGHFYKCVSDGQTPATYSWTEVQLGGGSSLPDQTGNAGKFLTTDGTDASWATISAIQNIATGYQSLVINTNPNATSTQLSGNKNIMLGYSADVNNTSANSNVIIGYSSHVSGNRKCNVLIGHGSESYSNYGTAIGSDARVAADNAIQLGGGGINVYINSDANTFKVGNANGNYEMMNANGNLPADRLASTTGLADGNYRLRLTMANGVPTLSWVAE